MTRSVLAALAVAASAGALACAGAGLGEAWVWKRPCATAAQLEVDRQACAAEASGVADPSDAGSEYGNGLFRECMESRGWQRYPSDTTLACE